MKTDLVVTPHRNGEKWTRRFGDRTWITIQQEVGRGVLAERVMKILELRFRLVVSRGALVYEQVGASLRFGPVTIPLPKRVSPRVEACERAVNGSQDETSVAVSVSLPLIGFLLSYEGDMHSGAES
jgi:hypothetical protein